MFVSEPRVSPAAFAVKGFFDPASQKLVTAESAEFAKTRIVN